MSSASQQINTLRANALHALWAVGRCLTVRDAAHRRPPVVVRRLAPQCYGFSELESPLIFSADLASACICSRWLATYDRFSGDTVDARFCVSPDFWNWYVISALIPVMSVSTQSRVEVPALWIAWRTGGTSLMRSTNSFSDFASSARSLIASILSSSSGCAFMSAPMLSVA